VLRFGYKTLKYVRIKAKQILCI